MSIHARSRFTLEVCLSVILAAACTPARVDDPSPTASDGHVTERPITETSNTISSVAWVTDNQIVFDAIDGIQWVLGSLDPTTGRVAMYPPSEQRGCVKTDPASPTVVAAQRVMLIVRCSTRGLFGWRNSLALLDDATGRLKTVPNSTMILFGDSVVRPNVLTADESGAEVSVGDRACGSIFAWTRDDGARPINLTLGQRQKSSTETYFRPGFQGARCEELGVAYDPTLSPDGARVAFAAKDIPGLEGVVAWLNAPSDVYVAEREWNAARPVVIGVRELRCLQWSPAGDQLAFVGTYRGATGIWLADVRTQVVTLLSDLAADCVGWSPDASKLAAVMNTGSLGEHSAVFVLSVPSADH